MGHDIQEIRRCESFEYTGRSKASLEATRKNTSQLPVRIFEETTLEQDSPVDGHDTLQAKRDAFNKRLQSLRQTN